MFFTEMKLTLLVFLLGFVRISAMDLTEIKLSFCNKLKTHWAYDRLNLKKTCLEIAKQLGSELCLDVIKIYFLFTLIYVIKCKIYNFLIVLKTLKLMCKYKICLLV